MTWAAVKIIIQLVTITAICALRSWAHFVLLLLGVTPSLPYICP